MFIFVFKCFFSYKMFVFGYQGDVIMWKPYFVNSDFNITAFYSAFVRSCKQEYFFQGESHDFWEMAYVIKGSVCMTVDDKVIRLSENNLIFNKPMEFHSMRTDSSAPTELFIMSFSSTGDFTKKFENGVYYLNRTERHSLMSILEFFKSCGEVKISEFIYDTYLETAFLKNVFKNPHNSQMLKNYTENFLLSLSNPSTNNTMVVRTSETEIYADALRIIDTHIYEKLTIDDLAKKCNASQAYLKKIFAKYNGLGIHEYILKNKIMLAKKMLSEGESVTNIAEKLGFSTQNYFSTAFKRETGVSPTVFKDKSF